MEQQNTGKLLSHLNLSFQNETQCWLSANTEHALFMNSGNLYLTLGSLVISLLISCTTVVTAASRVSSNAEVQGKIWVLYRLEMVVGGLNSHQKPQCNRAHTISTVRDRERRAMRENRVKGESTKVTMGPFNPNHTLCPNISTQNLCSISDVQLQPQQSVQEGAI